MKCPMMMDGKVGFPESGDCIEEQCTWFVEGRCAITVIAKKIGL